MKILVVLFSVTLLCSCGARSSDEQKIHALLEQGEEAAEERDTSDVLALIADDYTDSRGLDKTQLRDFLRAYFLMHPKIEVLVGIDDLEFPADGIAQANVTITSLTSDGTDREKLRVEFRRVGGDWRVARVDRAPG
jgi:hypothetical protein